VNPLLPAWYDIAWSVTAVVAFAVLLIALISLARVARSLSSSQALAWTLVTLFVPVLGPLAWLFIGRRSATASAGNQTVNRPR
jgi:hypothetical protein